MPQQEDTTFQKLEEEITCAICFHELINPVSIACGHTYCRNCILYYWNDPHLLQLCCPECRRICPRDQLIPVHKLKNLVQQIKLVAETKKVYFTQENLKHVEMTKQKFWNLLMDVVSEDFALNK
ncbi:hypothetical protein GDO86_019997 [Hymenochirus boettgeri]|nr:hypothetical protein GDO86_019997 [Hymenochirus boettgeri]